MPRRRTIFSIGYYYHIYNRAVAENQLFLNEDNYLFFVEKMRLYLLPVGKILAYCLMPNHYHILIQLTEPTLSAAMQRLALSYTVPFNHVFGRSGHLFQGRFQAKHVTDTQYMVHLSRYIHLNPKTAHLVKYAEKWRFSSLPEYYGTRIDEMVSSDVILNILADTDKISLRKKQNRYRKFVDSWDPAYMDFKQK